MTNRSTFTTALRFLVLVGVTAGMADPGWTETGKTSEPPPPSTATAPAGAGPAGPRSGAPPEPTVPRSERGILAEVIKYDEKAKTLLVKNFKGEEIPLVLDAKSEITGKIEIGMLARVRFDVMEGKNLVRAIRIMLRPGYARGGGKPGTPSGRSEAGSSATPPAAPASSASTPSSEAK